MPGVTPMAFLPAFSTARDLLNGQASRLTIMQPFRTIDPCPFDGRVHDDTARPPRR